MDPFKFTTIAHRHMAICNPVSSDALDACLEWLRLDTDDRVIDVGCGKGEMLIRLAERHGIQGTGIDLNPAFLDTALAKTAQKLTRGRVTFQQIEADRYSALPESFAAAICFGSTHALGDLRTTLRSLAAWVHSGGRVLIGEGYWKREPDPEYLNFLGAQPNELEDHAGNLAAGIEAGLTPVFDRITTPEEWDAYEGLYAQSVEEYVAAHPEDPDVGALRDRIRAWREGYVRWGRDTLGFGAYVFQKP